MPRKNSRPQTPEICPVCGEDVPPRALACPECGADHRSGWKEDANDYDALDLPDNEFNYDDFTRKEFGGNAKPVGIKLLWWIVILLVLAAYIVMALT